MRRSLLATAASGVLAALFLFGACTYGRSPGQGPSGQGPSGQGPSGPARLEPAGAASGGLDPALLDGVDELWVVSRGEARGQDQEAVPGAAALHTTVEGREVALPLVHTDVKARVDAYLASVDVAQRYENPFDTKIEAVYVFPLPQNAAVADFLMVIGERRIRGVVRLRDEAERIYEEARSQGYVASLLTQERPNVFTQKVANLEPGHRIDVSLTYHQVLPYRDGGYELAFPAVVGPRFNPPGSTDGIGAVPRGAQGRSGQTLEVPYLAPGEGSAHRLSIQVDLEAGVELQGVESRTHDVVVEAVSPTRRRVALVDAVPDRDFVLRWKVAGERFKTAFLTHRDETGGYFTLVLEPPADLASIGRAPMELIFVLDCSGSMQGVPLDKAKRAVERVLRRLSPRDSFQIIRFSHDASQLGPRPLPATPANVKRGLAYVRGLQGSGGTMMIEGIKAALDFPHDEGRVRLISFMTDGFIGNEGEILTAIHARLGASRIFSFGVGSAPNRFLLERMARLGQGAVAYIALDDAEADEAVDAFYERIAHPALSDVRVDFGPLAVSEVHPRRIPDLFVGRPVTVTGRFEGTLEGAVALHGRIGGREVSFPVPVRIDDRARPALPKVWARMKIMDLAHEFLFSRGAPATRQAIEGLALSYGLLSQFTAFVAVDTSRVTEGDHGVIVPQAVPVPAGVRYDTTVVPGG